MEEYRAGGLVRRCDGKTCVFHRDAQGRAITIPTSCDRKCGCKQAGRLAVIVPELMRLAYVIVETHSVYDIVQLTDNLHAAQALRGDLRGIPFILSRREREISTPTDGGGRVRYKKWLLFVEPDPAWVSRQLESMRIAALPVIGDLPTLTVSPRLLVDRGTGEIIDAGGWTDDDDEDADASTEPEAPTTISDYDNPFDGEPQSPTPTAKTQTATHPPIHTADAATVTRLTETAAAVYGERWSAEQEKKVAESASKGATQTLAGLTPREAEALNKILIARLAAKQNQAQKED